MAGNTSVASLLPSLSPGKGLADGSDLAAFVKATASGVSGLSALAGGGLVNSPVLASQINELTVVATANDSAVLPPALAGLDVWIINSGAQSLRLYAYGANPGNNNAADVIVPLAGGASVAFITVAANGVANLLCPSVGRWKSIVQ